MYHGTAVLESERTENIIPGHEACGIVEKVGKGVPPDELRAGDRVAIYLAVGCGRCEHCMSGWPILCSSARILAHNMDGGHAEFIKMPVENCLKLPDQMSLEDGALSTDKFGGLYHCHKRLQTSGRDTVAIIGTGPMGQMGIVCAKALGANVVAVDVRKSRLEQARQAGADHLINPTEADAPTEIRKITDGRGADIAIDCSGDPKGQNDALGCVKKEGKAAFIGESKTTTINPSDQFLRKRLTVYGNWYFPLWEYKEIARFIVSKGLKLEKYVTHTFAFEQVKEAYELFDAYKTGIVVFTF